MDALCSHRSSGRTSAQTRDPLFAQDVDKNGPVEPALLTTYESAEQKPVLSFPSSSWLSFQPRSVILLSTTIFGLFQQAVTISDTPPVIDQLSNQTINEGDTYTASGSFTDPDSTSWT